MSPKYLERVAQAFCFVAKPVRFIPFSSGHINNTFFVDCGEGNPQYILQRINTGIFQNPGQLMFNIKEISLHIARKVADEGGDPSRRSRTVIATNYGGDFYVDPDGGCWRAFLEIENVVSYDFTDDPQVLYQSAAAFGRFLKQLSDYPVDALYETIANFHDTRGRLAVLKEAVRRDKMSRAAEMQREIDFVLKRAGDLSYITDGIADGRLLLRVTHNDAKLSNVLMDKDTGEGICVIDLDTVMPGSLLYDFGETVRFGASTAKEDAVSLDGVELSLSKYEVIVRGFMGELRDVITKEEAASLPMGAYLMTLETGIRFLTDYLVGDAYYQTRYPAHNRDRARNQLKLAADMEQKLEQMRQIAVSVYFHKKGAGPLA